MRNILFTIVSFSLLAVISFGQETNSERTGAQIQPRVLIDCPTAGVLPKGFYDMDLRFFDGGGATFAVNIGLTERLMVGISYQAGALIGSNEINLQKFPLGNLKYRLIEETYFFPAIALGIDMQGHSQQLDRNTFYYKSKGFYLAFSKSYMLVKFPMGLHGGANYSTDNLIVDDEKVSKNNFLNGFIGADFGINEELLIFAEYDMAMDDNFTHNPIYGYLNMGIRWAVSSDFVIEFDFKDCINNKWILIVDPSEADIEADIQSLKRQNQVQQKFMTRELRCTFLTKF